MPFDLVAELVPGFKSTGKRRGMAHCPAHPDRSPSLSVREFDSGVLGLHCFGGCSVQSVVSALGLAMEDLFPPDDALRAGRKGEARPFTARQVLDALALELRVAWVLLSDIANGLPLDAAARRRAGVARARCLALIEELRSAR